MINPLPDRLGLGKNKTRAHVIHRRSLTSLGILEGAMDLDKRSDSWCGVEGTDNVMHFASLLCWQAGSS